MSQASSSSVILNWNKGSGFRLTDYRIIWILPPTAQNLIQAFCHIFHVLHTLSLVLSMMSSPSPLAQTSFCFFYYYLFFNSSSISNSLISSSLLCTEHSSWTHLYSFHPSSSKFPLEDPHLQCCPWENQLIYTDKLIKKRKKKISLFLFTSQQSNTPLHYFPQSSLHIFFYLLVAGTDVFTFESTYYFVRTTENK